MPQYKLVYFNIRGRAEVTRLLFAAAEVDYEDCRLTDEEFAAIKGDVTKAPLGQLPVLVVEGHPPIPQSHAIERYLARKFGMYGKNEAEAVQIDVACESVEDIYIPLTKRFYEEDEAKKAEIGKNFVEKDSVAIFTALCNALEKNTGGKGFFVGDKLSLADIAVFIMAEIVFKMFPVLIEKYPALKEFTARIRAEPKIAAWLAKRPVTEY